MEKSEVNMIKLNGKNYPSWAFQFQLYIEAKELWGHVSGTDPKPTEAEKKIAMWNTKDVIRLKHDFLDLLNLTFL